jgi:hypothetical protein
MEFTPWALATRVAPVDFLGQIAQTHYIVNLMPLSLCDGLVTGDTALKLIEPHEHERFVHDVSNSKAMWTDVLLLPRKLVNVGALLSTLGVANAKIKPVSKAS